MTIKQRNSPVAENMQRIIAESGMKQHVIAERLGCTPRALTDMIHGRKLIKSKDVPKICRALDVKIGELFRPIQT